jgi:type III pantothenate kinase
MLLAIDIGNTNVTLGLTEKGNWQHVWRLPTLKDEEALLFYTMKMSNCFLEKGVERSQVRSVVLSTVVPALRKVFVELLEQFFQQAPIVVEPALYPHYDVKVIRPNELGTDLYANALAAYYHFRAACVVVDFGTALTFTVVDDEGEIIGVSIAPGLKTAIAALFSKTAQLPEVPLELPERVLGQNTVHAIQSGVLIGYIGLVKHMIAQIRLETSPDTKVIATGGLSAILQPLHSLFDELDPNLTLNGLKIIGEQYPG